jgi:hypothetical protein
VVVGALDERDGGAIRCWEATEEHVDDGVEVVGVDQVATERAIIFMRAGS